MKTSGIFRCISRKVAVVLFVSVKTIENVKANIAVFNALERRFATRECNSTKRAQSGYTVVVDSGKSAIVALSLKVDNVHFPFRNAFLKQAGILFFKDLLGKSKWRLSIFQRQG